MVKNIPKKKEYKVPGTVHSHFDVGTPHIRYKVIIFFFLNVHNACKGPTAAVLAL